MPEPKASFWALALSRPVKAAMIKGGCACFSDSDKPSRYSFSISRISRDASKPFMSGIEISSAISILKSKLEQGEYLVDVARCVRWKSRKRTNDNNMISPRVSFVHLNCLSSILARLEFEPVFLNIGTE